MYTSEELVSLTNLGNGAAVEKFDIELQRVLDDLNDVNNDPKAERVITLVVKLKPSDTQGIITTQIECNPKMGKRKAFSTMLMAGHNGRHMEAREMFQQRPLEFKDADNKVVPIGKEE